MKTVKVLVGVEFVNIPVYRNGKPTKKTKKESCAVYTECDLSPVSVNGHVAFVAKGNVFFHPDETHRYLYHEDGTPITANCLYGKSGRTNHPSPIWLNEHGQIKYSTHGYDGATGYGWGARMTTINW